MAAPMESDTLVTNSLYPAAIVIAVLSCTIVLLDIPPLIWHMRNHNLGASTLIAWLVIQNLMSFINASIWPHDDMTRWWRGYGLCDVEVRLQAASMNALPGAVTCIMRHLARVLDTENIAISAHSEMLSRITDLAFCFGFPLWSMFAVYLVQDVRYYIFGISGCTLSVDNSWPSLVIVYIWPLLITLVAASYAGLVMTRIYRYRRAFKTILAARNTTRSRFMRLFAMALTIILGILPLQVYLVVYNYDTKLQKFDWQRVHEGTFSKIIGVPSFGTVRWDRWIDLVAGFLVFLFFGMGSDAQALYQAWAIKIVHQIFSATFRDHVFGGFNGNSSSYASTTATYNSKAKLLWNWSKLYGGGSGSEASRSEFDGHTTAFSTEDSARECRAVHSVELQRPGKVEGLEEGTEGKAKANEAEDIV